MSIENALICAWRLAGTNAEALEAGALAETLPDGAVWVHLDRTATDLGVWLSHVAEIPSHIVSALLQEDTRPRCEVMPQGIFLNLRGINFNEGGQPEDMLSLRAWLSGDLLVTLRGRPLLSVQAIRERLDNGTGPETLGNLLVSLAAGLVDRLGQRAAELSDELEDLEERAFHQRSLSLEPVSRVRASVVRLRRFTRPQLQALQTLSGARAEGLGEADRAFLGNTVDGVQRVAELLDELLERASILRDDTGNELAGRMARNMYTFTLLAGIFLPLGFITGLLGVNVAGIPGAQATDAFWVLCGLLVVVSGAEIWLLRRLRMWRA